ncbi:glycosyltransferase [Protaetiibacter larvae]|uniref:Glycosyltransferase family 1 protein n=1 Tax=Protaetiibacter larvae TaxID=2592654 RepID=A0A5C1Y8G8_9MICO|nr:glycosyltransferase [Protaetiibacter larvae]QEO10264.1 glycosyltransferase family 1 protein [Protaetiibacter larvae]
MSAREHDVVFTFSYETWDDAVRRGMMRPPDRLASALIAAPEVRRLIVANPFRWLPTLLARRLARRDSSFPGDRRARLVQPWRLRDRRDPVDLAALEQRLRAYGSALGRAARRAGMTEPVVLTTHPLVAGFGGLDWAHRVVYFGRDDWLSYPGRAEHWPAYAEAYRRIAASGMPVAAVSAQIVERIAPTGPGVVVPNGVEAAEWAGPQPEAPDWFAALPGPRAVYVGTIDERLDVEGLVRLAADRPAVSFVLLGPVPDPELLAPLANASNVTTHPGVGRAELVAVLRNADVALVAHRVTPLTEAMSPLKAYEYLAAGAPVLSVDLPPMRDIDARVVLSRDVAHSAPELDAALALGRAGESERLRFLEQNSWASRHRAIFALLFADRERLDAPRDGSYVSG